MRKAFPLASVCGLRRAVTCATLLACLVALPRLHADLAADTIALTRDSHRLTGTPEYERAADYVIERLNAIGPDRLVVQPFATPQTRVDRCELVGEGRTLPLLPMRPNGFATPTTPADGLSGRLVYAGTGTVDELAELKVRDAIVVLDYNCGEGWMRAFRLGAAAIVVVRNGPCRAWNSFSLEACANLPRYFFDGDPDALPLGAEVTIHADVTWEGTVGRNVFAFIEGTDPVFSQEKEEVIILACNLDSYGEVPRVSPGARGAANCAALLELAELAREHRPRRHLLFAFFDAQSRGHTGVSEFYRVLEEGLYNKGTDEDGNSVKESTRQEAYDDEIEFLEELADLLAHERPLQEKSDARRQLMNRLRERGKARAYEVSDRIQRLFEERKRLRDEARGLEEDERSDPAREREIAARIEEINRTVRERWQPEKDEWNSLRRALGRDDTSGLDGGTLEKLEVILDDVRRDLRLRRDELVVLGQSLEAAAELYELLGERWISLHLSLLLGDATERWGLLVGGDSYMRSWNDNPGLYGKVQSVFRRAAEKMADNGYPAEGFVMESADQTLAKTRVLWGAPFLIHSGEIAGLFGIYNLCAATCGERTPYEGTPDDVVESLNLDRVQAQVTEFARMLLPMEGPAPGAWDETTQADVEADTAYAVADQAALSLRRGIVAGKEYELPGFSGESVRGPMVMGMLPGSTMPNTPMPGAIVVFRQRPVTSLAFRIRKPYAFDNFQLLRTNQNGVYGMGPVTGGVSWFDGNYGGIAAVFDDRGAVTMVSGTDSYRNVRYRLNVFRAKPGVTVLPPQLRNDKTPADVVHVFSSKANGLLNQSKSYVEMCDGVAYWYSEVRERGIKLFGLQQMVALNNGAELFMPREEYPDPEGEGFAVGSLEPGPMATRSGSDLWRLNNSRLNLLRSKNILDSSLAELHGRAEDLLLAASRSRTPPHRESLATSAFWASRPVYGKTRAMLDDLIFAVLILLGLSVPFAFALERVVIGATTIYRQLAWFVIFFVLTFITLYLSHPAFAIANTPVIIFLGFAIVVMAVMVISIIMRKFEAELKLLQGMTTTVHAADVSRVSTFVAAMQMGISTMRRRPLRTALTAVTVILLTFTILSFASFGTQSGIVKLFSAPNPAYAGVWVHDVNWATLSTNLVDVLRGRWGDEARLHPRHWICPLTLDNPGLLLTREDGSLPVSVRGVLGMDPAEIAERPDLQELFGDDLEDGGVIMTRSLAEQVGEDEGRVLRVGDRVILGGVPLRITRLVRSTDMSAARDMDGSSILPVNFTEASSQQQTAAPTQEALLSRRTWASLPVDSVVVVSVESARELGAALYGIMMYTDDTADATRIGEDLARMLSFPIIATRTNGAYLHLLGTVLAASGVKDLFFPILLGGLVIFGTMLGSVSDREKEIYTFSALGLAPKHVATLFFAESTVFSLLGGMGGYLLAQGTLKILTVLADYGWVVVPEMNMSSTNTIVTILIVMATVLVSAIYPAVKASKSANPGLMRVWRPPEPVGDELDLVFPFTVSEYDITGVVSFLKEHFDNYSDTGLGHFMSSDTRLAREQGGQLGLHARLALAPFDLGVSQSFQLCSAPSEIPGIDEVRIRLERASGQPKDWQRLNKVFMDDLRKQFLIWRSLPQETMEQYRRRTLVTLGQGQQETGE